MLPCCAGGREGLDHAIIFVVHIKPGLVLGPGKLRDQSFARLPHNCEAVADVVFWRVVLHASELHLVIPSRVSIGRAQCIPDCRPCRLGDMHEDPPLCRGCVLLRLANQRSCCCLTTLNRSCRGLSNMQRVRSIEQQSTMTCDR